MLLALQSVLPSKQLPHYVDVGRCKIDQPLYVADGFHAYVYAPCEDQRAASTGSTPV